jgi:muramoyltetrapeptide carboxypeptidase LdcA involved in peptidoglycan recycling
VVVFEAIKDYLKYNFPIAFDVEIGHNLKNEPIILSETVNMVVSSNGMTLKLLN